VIEEIGRGMHGKVKLARNLETGESVAIKIIPRFSKKRRLGKEAAISPQERAKKEIAILKKIRHPNVVALLEVIDDPELKKIYMVLEHAEYGEIVWRKKGLPHVCQYERRRVEREMHGGKHRTPEDERYEQILGQRQSLKERKRENMAQNFTGPTDYWSVEHGAADESVSSSKPHDDYGWESEEKETPGPLRSNPNSATHLEGTMYGAYMEDSYRGRRPSVADSIFSYMSSIDFFPQTHDSFADEFSYVPCFSMDQARAVFRNALLGLEYLHYQGVVHRDIKPANLLWCKGHRVKISDFGVSYFGRPIRDGELDETVSELEAMDFDGDLELAKTVGTPAFSAPELCYTDIHGEQHKVSEQIDMWSLGVTLYCLIFLVSLSWPRMSFRCSGRLPPRRCIFHAEDSGQLTRPPRQLRHRYITDTQCTPSTGMIMTWPTRRLTTNFATCFDRCLLRTPSTGSGSGTSHATTSSIVHLKIQQGYCSYRTFIRFH
jgi:SNF1-activating kinase 1